jgi:predicted ATPase
MSIKSITIENFKGIREPVKFELAPIVLLYGPNSAGKSTLLQALAYLNDVIVHQDYNGEYTRSGGESMYLGGFANIVNGHDVSKNIRFVFEIDNLSSWNVVGFAANPTEEYDGGYSHFLKNRNDFDKELPYLTDKLVKDGLHIEIIISWDAKNKQAFLSRCRYIAQEAEVMDISVMEAEGGSTIKFNFGHPCFRMDNNRYVSKPNPEKDYGWDSLFHCITRENSLLMSPESQAVVFKNKGIFEWPHFNEYGFSVYPVHMKCYLSEFKRIDEELEKLSKQYTYLRIGLARPLDEDEATQERIYFESDAGIDACKKRDAIMKPVAEMPLVHNYINTLLVTYFSTVISGSLEVISNFLNDPIYIGPLRKRPDSTTIQQNNMSNSWHDGMMAWQLLNGGCWGNYQCDSNQVVMEVNQYLGGTHYFNSGYHIKTGKVLTMEVEVAGEIQKLFEQDDNIDLAELRQQLNHHSQFKKILKLHDLGRGVDVDLTAVGTGISQIVPIIMAMILEDVNVVMVEQPELHIHPRMQVQLGELMVDSLMSKRNNNEKQKLHLIETHSEALLLRLMRRIREPSNGGYRLTPQDLAVYYVDSTNGSTRISERVEIDDEGDFIDEWPGVDGFFEESFNENFGGREKC